MHLLSNVYYKGENRMKKAAGYHLNHMIKANITENGTKGQHVLPDMMH